jgi:hypothetical protein
MRDYFLDCEPCTVAEKEVEHVSLGLGLGLVRCAMCIRIDFAAKSMLVPACDLHRCFIYHQLERLRPLSNHCTSSWLRFTFIIIEPDVLETVTQATRFTNDTLEDQPPPLEDSSLSITITHRLSHSAVLMF